MLAFVPFWHNTLSIAAKGYALLSPRSRSQTFKRREQTRSPLDLQIRLNTSIDRQQNKKRNNAGRRQIAATKLTKTTGYGLEREGV
jgi:hypothetical protein